MTTLAFEINDVSLRVLGEDGLKAESPGFAVVNGDVVTGNAARAQARLAPGRVFDDIWGNLSLEALPASVRGAATRADLAYHHLKDTWSAVADGVSQVILVVPGSYDREQLSLLLGIARECAIPVSGIVDQAVVAAEQAAPGRHLMHLELMQKRAVLTTLTQGGRLRRAAAAAVDDAGLGHFHDAWAAAVGDVFVRNTRYDPMHSAESEQELYDALPGWLSQPAGDGKVALVLQRGDRDFRADIGRQTLAEAAEPLYRRLTRSIAAASRPGEPVTLMLSDRLGAFPGLRDALSAGMPGCEFIELVAGQAGTGALRRAEEIATSGGDSIAFVTSVSWRRDPVSLPLPGDNPPDDAALPTHVLYRGRAIRIADQVHLGAQPADGQPSVVLIGDLAGVSGDHALIVRRDGGVFVQDRSQHGTFVNDRRVDGECPVHYGDVLRLGGPDQLLQLITVSQGNGA